MNLNHLPAWLIGVVLALIFPLAIEAGYRLHGLVAKGEPGRAEETGAGHIVSAALGLMGLLIAFTFAMAADRYETRRHLVMQEANAISTAWQVQRMVAEPERSQLDALMKPYVRYRLAYVAAGTDEARLEANAADARAVRQQIWAQTASALRGKAALTLANTILPATAQMFELAATRREALEETVPAAILWSLIAYSVASAGLLGYGLAASARRHVPGSVALFALVALTVALIVDLDQPRSGGILVSQETMQRIAAEILGTPAPQ